MPELPEVETLRLGLISKVIDHKIISVQILQPKIVASNGTKRIASSTKTKEFTAGVTSKKIIQIERIAKNLVFTLADKNILVVHLKMTGQLVFVGEGKERIIGGHPTKDDWLKTYPSNHTRIIFQLDNGVLYYNDVRMFGYVLYYKNIAEAKASGHFKNIGLEPFAKAFTLKYFTEELKKHKKTIKGVLLDQSIVTGCGNIYSDEVCFLAGIRPTRIANTLTKTEISKLYKNIPKLLRSAIKHGGTSMSDYLNAEGKKGNFMKFLQVYGRTGELCKVCNTKLKSLTVAGRRSVYCPKCQK